MPKFKIKNRELSVDLTGEIPEFPKYTTQIINLANQNSQGTRPKVVGQMSELIQEFDGRSYLEWKEWYLIRQPNAITDATEKVYTMIEKLKEAILLIDKKMVEKWATDLVLSKTYTGLCFQESILKQIANRKKTSYRLATPSEESNGIDGFIGDIPVSIKPITYQTKNMLQETINANLIFYDKKKDGINVTYDF